MCPLGTLHVHAALRLALAMNTLFQLACRSASMLRAFTFELPVIFEAITTFERLTLSLASHEPMICSVAPSGCNRLLGIGYCSAVSIRLTPAATDLERLCA